MLFVSHDRTFLRGLSNRVQELRPGDGNGTPSLPPLVDDGSYVEFVERTGSEAAGGAPAQTVVGFWACAGVPRPLVFRLLAKYRTTGIRLFPDRFSPSAGVPDERGLPGSR